MRSKKQIIIIDALWEKNQNGDTIPIPCSLAWRVVPVIDSPNDDNTLKSPASEVRFRMWMCFLISERFSFGWKKIIENQFFQSYSTSLPMSRVT
jgi:hypothetical protein